MTTTKDFETLKQNRDVAELAIKIRADMEYCKRVLEEHLANWTEDTKNANLDLVPESIKTERLASIKKYQTLVDDLDLDHSEFLTIV